MAIHQECQRRGIVFLVATQQRNSTTIDRHLLKGMTYRQEVAHVRARMAQQQEVELEELHFLAHAVLMNELEEWAASNGVDLVDVISELDDDRSEMVSQVHLNARANRLVAEALAARVHSLVGRRPPAAGQAR